MSMFLGKKLVNEVMHLAIWCIFTKKLHSVMHISIFIKEFTLEVVFALPSPKDSEGIIWFSFHSCTFKLSIIFHKERILISVN